MSNQQSTGKIALITGVTGSVGSEVAKALLLRNWTVRALHRHPDKVRHLSGFEDMEWFQGDAMDKDAVARAATGVNLIFHGANPPKYNNWAGLAVPMLANTIHAARVSGARVVFPGNIYNYGPDAGSLIGEDAPQHPVSRKGAVRVKMEKMLEEASKTGVRSLIVRAGDYFGPHALSSWFGGAILKPGLSVRSLTYPGKPGIGHTWAYLPDLAKTIAELAEIESALPMFDTFNFEGHWLEDGYQLIAAIRRVADKPNLPVRSLPWTLLFLAIPFSALIRELMEMRYLWHTPIRLDNGKLRNLLGAEPHTPLDDAIRASMIGLGCLPEADQSPHARGA